MSRHPLLLMARELGVGGSERQLAEIARSLDRDSFSPRVGCFRTGGFRAEELRQAGVPVVHFPLDSFRSPALVAAAREMQSYVRRNGIEIVHTFDVPSNLFGVPVARAAGVPHVISSQRAHRDLTPGLRRRLLRVTDRIADAIVVNCASVQRELVEEDGVPPAKIHVCRNGIDTRAFRPGARQLQPALEGSRLVIGVVCALRPEKDLGTLIQAFGRIRDLRSGLRLAIVGSGAMESSLRALCHSLSLNGAVHFEPSTSRPADWLHAIDIFVLPSRSEALSNSLMEAMACACCPVASRTGGNPELIEEGVTGLLFDSGDPVDLARKLRRVIENESLRTSLARAAAARVSEQFALEACARNMEAIYHAVLSGEQVRPRAQTAEGSGWSR